MVTDVVVLNTLTNYQKVTIFLFIQEHWLLRSQLDMFQKKMNNAMVHGIPSKDDEKLLVGRPYGGCAIKSKLLEL